MPAEVEQTLDEASRTKELVDLIGGIMAGDEPALERFYEATIDRIYALASRILGQGPDAEEITEDVYLYVWRNAERFDADQGHPMAWLVTLVRSRAIDRLRHLNKHARVGAALADAAATADIVEEEPFALLHGTRLMASIEALPQVQRQILTLAYFRGMTHAEIAQDLGMSLGTVKTHIRRTLIALRVEVEA
ncbi:MAG: sigma-70 family RNA polymerase sigma factor [Pseudomonadota bacterium]